MFNPNFANQYGYGQSMPYMPDFSAPKQPQNNVSWVYVNGMEGAKNQIVQPGQTSWMMDNTEPIIYVKAVDGMGTANFKAFRLTEISGTSTPENRAADMSDYVRRDDLSGIVERIKNLEELIGGLNA